LAALVQAAGGGRKRLGAWCLGLVPCSSRWRVLRGSRETGAPARRGLGDHVGGLGRGPGRSWWLRVHSTTPRRRWGPPRTATPNIRARVSWAGAARAAGGSGVSCQRPSASRTSRACWGPSPSGRGRGFTALRDDAPERGMAQSGRGKRGGRGPTLLGKRLAAGLGRPSDSGAVGAGQRAGLSPVPRRRALESRTGGAYGGPRRAALPPEGRVRPPLLDPALGPSALRGARPCSRRAPSLDPRRRRALSKY